MSAFVAVVSFALLFHTNSIVSVVETNGFRVATEVNGDDSEKGLQIQYDGETGNPYLSVPFSFADVSGNVSRGSMCLPEHLVGVLAVSKPVGMVEMLVSSVAGWAFVAGFGFRMVYEVLRWVMSAPSLLFDGRE